MGKKSGLVGVAVLVLPILEVVALVLVGNALGFFNTLALFIGLSVAGAWILRARLAGLTASAMGNPAQGGSTTDTLYQAPQRVGSAVLAAVGGGLMMLPGFVTAAVGLLLQIGPIRSALAHRVSAQFGAGVGSVGARFGMQDLFAANSPFNSHGHGDVIDTDLAPDPESTTFTGPQELS